MGLLQRVPISKIDRSLYEPRDPLAEGYFSAVASGAAWLSGAPRPVVKALRKRPGSSSLPFHGFPNYPPSILSRI